jgi:hypothetical protein
MSPRWAASRSTTGDRGTVRSGWSTWSCAIAVAVSVGARVSRAEQVLVPLERQAELLALVAAYDRNMTARAGDQLHVLLVTNAADPESVGTAHRMEAALRSLPEIAGKPHDERVEPFTHPADLANECRSLHAAIVYVGSGLTQQIPAIRAALDGVDVLTVAALPEYVDLGVILGFDVFSGKPKLLVHLTQARRQHVDLRSDLLKLAKVIQ